ncbi:MAG: hypothetical protein JXQ96_21805 [Cyclobacteriaceae bacterium]
MKNQVVELVVYKVKKEFVGNFQSDIMPEFRKLVNSFGGLVSYTTFNSLNKDGMYFDEVIWESVEHASMAIVKFEQMKKKGEHAELMNWFDEVTFMDHFKKVS